MPIPLITLAMTKAIGIGTTFAVNWANGRRGSNEVSTSGARITNEIESAMDLNRAAFESGTIPIHEFDANWKALWTAFKEAADQIAQFDAKYAQGMIGDRVRGGQFGSWWQGTLHEDPMNWARGKMDSGGFILPQFQKPWPLKAKYVDTNPYNQLPNVLPSVTQALEQAGETAGERTGTLIEKFKQVGAGTLLAGGLALLAGVAVISGKVKL